MTDSMGDSDLFSIDRTGALVTLNKDERILVHELLLLLRHSNLIRSYVIRKLGEQYVEIGFKIFENLNK